MEDQRKHLFSIFFKEQILNYNWDFDGRLTEAVSFPAHILNIPHTSPLLFLCFFTPITNCKFHGTLSLVVPRVLVPLWNLRPKLPLIIQE